jgi:hypothetical protein
MVVTRLPTNTIGRSAIEIQSGGTHTRDTNAYRAGHEVELVERSLQ